MGKAIPILLLFAALPALADQFRHSFQSSVPRGKVRRVVIDIPAGDIDVRNGAPDRVAISGWVKAKEQRIADDTSVEIDVNNDEAIVRRRFGPEARGWRGGMLSGYHVNVEVPPGTAVEVQTHFGDISIEGSFGDIDVDLRAGDIDVRIPKKDVRELSASARVGDVRAKLGDEIIEREGIFPGTTRYRNPNGKTIVNVHATAGDVKVDLH
ncbi:MAG TPA: DUF4097 family beta strand repeat-containing protein [Thermoanaerobaculia bacterium]|jgi:hypothetical protein|nr:DUF4097 family beta strand repeat-containing protein [Thermoanaerobaculia bacterium]